MRGAILLLLAVALVPRLAWAQSPGQSIPVIFHTRPEGLSVYKIRETKLDFLGLSSSSRPLMVTLSGYDRDVVRFLILPPGQEPPDDLTGENLQLVPTRLLVKSQRFPSRGEFVMDLGWKDWLADTLRRWAPFWLIMLSTLAGLATWWVRARRRSEAQLQSARHLERLRAETAHFGDPMIGTEVGGYRIEGVLGKGGMAVVYRVVPVTAPDQVYALKLLHRASADDQLAQERFKREITLTSQLVHPNIVPVVDFGHHNGLPYLVMVLVDGSTLVDKVGVAGLAPDEALSLLEPVFAAISFAHKRGIVHRDLKPDNVLLTCHQEGGELRSRENQHILVTDFGVAHQSSLQSMTVTGQILGTPSYMAPEQIEGKSVPATDQYALAIMLFELLTGQLPFLAEDPMKMLFAHLSEPPRSITEVRPDLPRELAEVVSKMLAKKPDQRYADLDEALHSLRRAAPDRS